MHIRLSLILAITGLTGCESNTFECGGKALGVIPADQVCDGVVDCWGGQDERGDDCPTELFFCEQPEPQAVLEELVCDGTDDCGDGADEVGCAVD